MSIMHLLKVENSIRKVALLPNDLIGALDGLVRGIVSSVVELVCSWHRIILRLTC
jgi:hypothetical protein